jgi:iron complex outermembrane receptor protein
MLTPCSRLRGAMFAAVGLQCADAPFAFAQEQPPDGIQEIVVTAQRREENLQTTPIAITAISADALNRHGDTDFAGVADSSTSINFTRYPSSSNTLTLYMRGQGVADANQITQDGSVGLYEDGFYVARPQAETFDLADVDLVEVLRGPQGTLYGRNTTGGAVNIISKKPSGDLDFKISLDGGSRDYVRALGVVDLPKVASGLSSKVTLLYTSTNGNVHNSGGEDYNKEKQKGGRAALRWNSGSLFTADYFLEIGEIDSTPIYYQDAALAGLIPGYPATNGRASNTWEPIALPLSVAKYNAHGLTLTWKLSDSATLRSLTGYRGLDSRFAQDYAGAFGDPATAGFIGVTNFGSTDVVQSNEFTQEFQFVGDLGRRFNYVAGLYYFQEHANHTENGTIGIPLLAPGAPLFFPFNELDQRYVTTDAKSKALYAQGTWKLTNPLSLTLGGRYTKDDRGATRNLNDQQTITALIPGVGPLPVRLPAVTDIASNSLSFNKFNPAGTLNMGWTSDLNTYLRIATGYKAGGSSESGPPGEFGLTFAPETVTTYELGLKSYWFDRTARANVALFHSDFKNMQLQFQVNPSNLAIEQAYNAGTAKVNGAELELLFMPVNDFTFGINYTYLHTSIDTVTVIAGTIFDPTVNPLSPYHVGDNVASVFRLPYAPNGILNLTADYAMLHTTSGSLELSLNYRYQGRQYDTATTGPAVANSEKYYSISPYGVLSGRLTWNFHLSTSKRTASLSLWGKNITNEKYPEHVVGEGPIIPLCTATAPGSGVCAPSSQMIAAGYTYQAVAWAPKAVFGVQFRYGF